jgi:hypothetical protein
MNVPYLVRLFGLSLASFFLLHAALGAVFAALTPLAERTAERMHPRRAAGFLLGFRLFPPALASLLVGGLCVPSYIWLEPQAAEEGMGFACLAAALLGAAVLALSLFRGLRAISDSARFLRECRSSLSRTTLPGHVLPNDVSPVWIVEQPVLPVVALTGVIRPRVVVSSRVLSVLSPTQLDIALLHERAHLASHDNLKRLLVILAPDLIPFVNPWTSIERSRAKFAEWAADDEAAAGDAARSLSLAETLVKVARAGSWSNPSPLLASFVERGGTDLAARVDRLLGTASPGEESARRFSWFANASVTAVGCAVVLSAPQPSVLHFVHEILERLIA